MTKLQVFIDFEAISAPFSSKLKVNNDLPYAYSYGVHQGSRFKTRTTIIDFNKINKEDVFEFIRKDISDGLRSLTGNKTFKANKDTITFIGWAPNLEKKVLSKAFKGVRVTDQTKGESISLSSLTQIEYKEITYFETLKKEVEKKLDPEFVIRRGLHHDGALAALAGYLLYKGARNIKDSWNIEIDTKQLLKEIKIYSKDDIVRMSFLFKNSALFAKRKKELIEKNKKKQTLSRRLNRLVSLSKSLANYDKEMTVEKLTKDINKEIEILKKDKDNL